MGRSPIRRSWRVSAAGTKLLAVFVLATGLLAGSPAGANPSAAANDDETTPAEIRLGDSTVFVVRVPRAGAAPAARARKSVQLLELAVGQAGRHPVRVMPDGAMRVVYVGTTPVLQLSPEDATGNGDASVDVTAARVATHLRSAITNEHTRARISDIVFSVSLAVLAAVLSWLLVRRANVITRAARIRIATREREGRAFPFAGGEVASRRSLARTLDSLVVTANLLVRLGALLAWSTFALSLFPATLTLRAKLVRAVVAPIEGSLAALSSIAETALVGLVWLAVVGTLVRLVGAFFTSVARGDAKAFGIDRTHAPALSALVRLAIVFAALAVVAPAFAKHVDVLPKVLEAFLFALAFGFAPSLASAAVGARLVLGGGLRVGDEVRVLERRGRVHALGLFDFVLHDENGTEVRIAYAPLLFRPLEVTRSERRKDGRR